MWLMFPSASKLCEPECVQVRGYRGSARSTWRGALFRIPVIVTAAFNLLFNVKNIVRSFFVQSGTKAVFAVRAPPPPPPRRLVIICLFYIGLANYGGNL